MRVTRPLLLTLAWTAACGRTEEISVVFPSDEIKKAVRELRIFTFDDASGTVPDCAERLDPWGRPPGDAEERTGLVAAAKRVDDLKDDEPAELTEVPARALALVVEAWGPPCSQDRGIIDCRNFQAQGAPVMRAYRCEVIDFERNRQTERVIDLLPTAELGSRLEVPTQPIYSAGNPLPVVEGVVSSSMFIRAVGPTEENLDGVAISWSVRGGPGSMATPQPDLTRRLTFEKDSVQTESAGVSEARVRAYLGARKSGGRQEVLAHAVGFESSPVVVPVVAVGSVETELRRVVVPRERLDLAGMVTGFPALVITDLDGDERDEVVFSGGTPATCDNDLRDGTPATHKLGVAYRTPEGFSVATSTQVPHQITGMVAARLGSGPRTIITFSRSACSGLSERVANGSAYVAKSPAVEIWSGLDRPPVDGELRARVALIHEEEVCELGSCSGVQAMTKFGVAGDAVDMDPVPDQVDELVISRCSYMQGGASNQFQVNCQGEVDGTSSDSELAVLRVDSSGGTPRLVRIAAVANGPRDGGFREVRILDFMNDGGVALVASTQSKVVLYCGRRSQGPVGFGFGGNPQRSEAAITYVNGFSVGAGHFNSDGILDTVGGGTLKATGADSGYKVNVGADGCMLLSSTDRVPVGPRTPSYRLQLRVAELNGDEFDDVAVLHGDAREVQFYFGVGTGLLARGPVLQLPAGPGLGFDLAARGEGAERRVTFATTVPATNEIWVGVVRPAP